CDLLWLVGLPITEIVNHHAGSMTVYIYLRVDIPVNFVGIRQGQGPFGPWPKTIAISRSGVLVNPLRPIADPTNFVMFDSFAGN
ncbi:MAG: hypothetical protein ACREXS_03540, partial [Gammaproteobacteria bacterium]